MPVKTGYHHKIGNEKDVHLTANDISPLEITAVTIGGKSYPARREALLGLIDELRARLNASERGEDLAPILKDAENALAALEREGYRRH